MADYLVIAGETPNPDVFKAVDLSGLLSESTRGDNEVLPYVEGQVEYLPWLDQIDTTVEWKVNGFWTVAGAIAADVSDTLDDNVEHYRALFRDNLDAVGRVEVDLHTGNRVLSGLMQCRRWQPVRTGYGTKTVVTRLVVGAGRLTA